ncbi:hypothetical protein [Aurantimonas sp. VKM B-3413]|uniref:hypothetical protein n=1 Tax=Aurantimonas sp. VKM B-3413 TaxID=2779401 RepID=UPI001E2D5A9B|nr:hypothetical protein [Aurantimonas sp. VKM B-3413]MCB8838180.1 hypothetical protein [Aurantimonas sp. VKM B-3413]
MRRTLAFSLLCCTVAVPPALAQEQVAPVKVTVTDKSFDVGAGMFAYTEYELSGEPLAESLGLDLDILDPDQANQPTPFDFAAGIDTYEYSEEAMYAVNYASQLGPHLANGPVNAARGGTLADLGKRVITLAGAVGFSPDELQQNLYPLTFPFAKGMPEYGQSVDMTQVGSDAVDATTHSGEEKSLKTVVPAYYRDFKTLAWKSDAMDRVFTPTAAGGEMLKDVMWSQDFLGGMHVKSSDEEVSDVEDAKLDQDGTHALGVSSADGMNGMLLTEITWDKLRMLRDRFGYDGKTLGAKIGPQYDPKTNPVWFPERVSVDVAEKNGVNAVGDLKVVDGGSSLRDAWMMLWPLGEMYGFSDQRSANKNQNKAFLAVFDGDPFPAAPQANRGTDRSAYESADDPFSLTETLSNMTFKNLDALHYNTDLKTFVDSWSDGQMGDEVTTFDAAYAIVALDIYERAVDALPVGYASASSGDPLGTPEGKRATALIKAEADFIVNRLIGEDGLVADSFAAKTGASDKHSLGTQFAAIRGLSAAFVATGDETYRTAARKIYDAVETKMFDEAAGIFNPNPGKAFEVDAWTAGAVEGGLRALLQTLHNKEGEDDPHLTLANLTQRYTRWFHVAGRGLQLAEWLGDSGEHVVDGQEDGDANGNGINRPDMAGGEFGTAPVMAARIEIDPTK